MGLVIVVLAAGLGTRYRAGGAADLKQLAPLGPAGEALLDYTLYDAAHVGFSDAVLVVAREIVEPMRSHLREFVAPMNVRLVAQDAGAHASQQATPLGTAHATVVGATGLTSPFAVANADDLYGRDALAAMHTHLAPLTASTRARSEGAVVGYPAHTTLSATGGVSRAVCRVDDHGRLLEVAEHTGVRREGDHLVSDRATLDDTTLVSMNLWGFDPSFVDVLRPLVDRFVADRADGGGAELRLPDVVGGFIARGDLDVTVLPTTSTWLGVTHPRDAPIVRERLAELTAAGVYPARATTQRPAR